MKSFSASSKVSKTVKTIDFASVIDNMTSHGFQVKALISQTRAMLRPPDNGKISFSAVEIVFFLIGYYSCVPDCDRDPFAVHGNGPLYSACRDQILLF